jgi:hypothetical protein
MDQAPPGFREQGKVGNESLVGTVDFNGPSATAQDVIGGATSRADYCHKKPQGMRAIETPDAPMGARRIGTTPSNSFREFSWPHKIGRIF